MARSQAEDLAASYGKMEANVVTFQTTMQLQAAQMRQFSEGEQLFKQQAVIEFNRLAQSS